jgi:glucose/arabinose dehydrogenase
MRKSGFFALLVISFFVTAVAPVSATTNVTLDTITSVDRPTDIATRAGDPALYVAEQDGKVVRFIPDESGKGRSSVALDITALTTANGEQGLLGLAFHPRGTSVFVNYTNNQGNTVVARYAIRTDGKVVASSRTILFTLNQPYANHNGGGLSFGPGDRLFIGTGDGGSGGDPKRYALDRKSLLGKIISIDPNASGAKTNDARIWAVGLRNPWRFEFDADNNLWIADVGQNTWEEVNVAWATNGSGRNANFGWSAYEGNERFNNDQRVAKHTRPVHVYKHGDAGCSISGGTRIRSSRLAALRDWYVYGDYCSGNLTALWVTRSRATKVKRLATDVGPITAVRSVASGDVYVLTHNGKVARLSASRPS